ncbi:hypothetical protein ACH0B6_20550 [Solibacillus silvestris]
MKRESLFETVLLEEIKDYSLINWDDLQNKKKTLEEASSLLLQDLNCLTKSMFENGDFDLIANYQKVKKLIKKRHPIKQELLSDCIDTLKIDAKYYNAVLKTVSDMEKEVERAFDYKNSYKSFILSDEFQDAIKVTAENASKQLLDTSISKDSVNRARYGYIQRATVKTSPLSYFGKTFYYSNQEKKFEQIRLNHVVKYLILMASMYNRKLDTYLKIKIRPVVEKCSHEKAAYYEKNYLLQGFEWVIKQDDFMHQRNLVEILESLSHCATPEEIKNSLGSNDEITYELLVNNGLVIPDFQHYLQNNSNFDRLLEVLFTKEDLELFYPSTIRDIKHDKLRKLIINYLKEFDNEYSGQTYEKTLEQISLFYHDYVELQSYDLPSIEPIYKQNLLNEYVVPNEKGHFIQQLINSNKEIYKDKSIISVFADIHEKIQYKKLPHQLKKASFKPSMKKNALIYVQSENSEIILNNINIGTGGVYHRYGQYFNDEIKERLSDYYTNLFESKNPIYELIIDEEISNHMDVGNTIFPKLNWPADFVDVTLEINCDAIKFVKDGKNFELVYTGTVPYYLFTGVKSYLLQLIHPWAIDMKAQLEEKRTSYKIELLSICEEGNLSDIEFYHNLREYFKQNNLPLDFFVKKKYIQFSARKPIWISLESVESVKVLRHLLQKEKTIEIEDVKPRFTGGKVKEYCILIAEGEM